MSIWVNWNANWNAGMKEAALAGEIDEVLSQGRLAICLSQNDRP